MTGPKQSEQSVGGRRGGDLGVKDYAYLRGQIATGTVTLGELYDKIARDFGSRLDEIHASAARGESRSHIRNVCRRVAEFRDGTPVHLLVHNYHKRVQPRGTHSARVE